MEGQGEGADGGKRREEEVGDESGEEGNEEGEASAAGAEQGNERLLDELGGLNVGGGDA